METAGSFERSQCSRMILYTCDMASPRAFIWSRSSSPDCKMDAFEMDIRRRASTMSFWFTWSARRMRASACARRRIASRVRAEVKP
eukprot:scaffold28404_cov30-Tisochrysis_lutea.AAC.2